MIPTVGVDPGGKYVGVLIRHGNRGHELTNPLVITRDGSGLDTDTLGPWITQVVDVVADYLTTAVAMVDGTSMIRALQEGTIRLAVEGMVAPKGFSKGQRAPINPAALIGPSAVKGALLAIWPDLVLVRPGGHGDQLDAVYPEAIRANTRGLGGPPKHARSAWDIAGAADGYAMLERATRQSKRP